MKPLLLFPCFFFLIPQLLASELAGPYQTMLIWYAYRLDIKTYGIGKTWIASGCRGSAPDGSCYFDELLKCIQNVGTKNQEARRWKGSTSVGQNLYPDVYETAMELDRGQPRFNNVIKAQLLLPNTFDKGINPTFSDVYDKVIEAIQICRAEWKDVGLERELEGVRRSIVSVLDARWRDQAPSTIKGLNQKLSDAGYSGGVKTRNYLAADSSVWEDIDTEATIKAYPGLDHKVLGQMIEGLSTDDESYAKHAATISASQNYQSRLLEGYDC